MSMWKILLTDGLEEVGQEYLRQSAEVVNQPKITAEELLVVAKEYDALIVRGRTKVIPAVFEAAGDRLKVVGRAGVGVDNIDLKAAQAHNVIVVNSPIATTISVAELAMSLMMAVAREIPRADATMKAGQWIKKELVGVELYGKTLGVIGFGRIGATVGARAAGFGMKVLGCGFTSTPEQIRQRGGEPVSLDELLTRSDIISLHIPLTNETRNILNAEAFAKMKDGVRIICAARGGVIDEAALLAALESGKVAAAGLDVFIAEPPGLTALVAHPRVVCTPHIGAQTVEAQERTAIDIGSEVLAALKGEALRWRVA